MNDDARQDLTQSSADFVCIVWPIIQKQCAELRGSVLRLVEGPSSTQMAFELDVWAGIDAYQRTPVGLRGIAARVQWGADHQTFTVRISRPSGALTEYTKRLTTIKRREEGFLYPYWTIQAYVDQPGGTLLSVGVAKSIELYLYIEQRERSGHPCPRRPAANGREEFLYVEWKEYQATGNYLFTSLSKKETERHASW